MDKVILHISRDDEIGYKRTGCRAGDVKWRLVATVISKDTFSEECHPRAENRFTVNKIDGSCPVVQIDEKSFGGLEYCN